MPPGKTSPAAGPHFVTTHWSLVLAAGNSGHPRFQDALSELCRLYWTPIRQFIRRRVGDEAQADDLTQGFFAALLERQGLADADAARGRFRSFLLTAAKYYLADQYDRARALKRGGGAVPISLDASNENHPAPEPADPRATPDREYDRQWALALLAHVRGRLDRELTETGDAARMRLASLLTEENPGYREVARELGMSESAVKVAMHRLRKRYAVILREEVARTVESPAAVDEELRYVLAAIAG